MISIRNVKAKPISERALAVSKVKVAATEEKKNPGGEGSFPIPWRRYVFPWPWDLKIILNAPGKLERIKSAIFFSPSQSNQQASFEGSGRGGGWTTVAHQKL